jgi:hypothetical protein
MIFIKEVKKVRKRYVQISLVLILTIFTFGCMSASFRDLTRKSFSAPEFTSYEMETGKIAFLPTVSDAQYARSIDVALIDSFKNFHPGIAAIGGDESRRLLQEAGLVEDYSQMMDTYARTAIVNQSILSKMGDAARARYLVYTRLLKYSEYEDREKERTIYELSIKGEIWDARTGEVVWDATGSGRMEKTLVDKPVTFEEILWEVCDSLIQKIP